MLVSMTIQLRVHPDFRSHFDREAEYREALSFTVEVDKVEQALNAAFDICNSYAEVELPHGEKIDELFGYARGVPDLVKLYRDGNNRSLSVGDTVTVTHADGVPVWDRYMVASFGFELLDFVAS